jgi:hypothetical protein
MSPAPDLLRIAGAAEPKGSDGNFCSGGPQVAAPTRRGFGTSLLKAVCTEVAFDYGSEGLRCEFELRLSKSELGALGESDPAVHH